MKRTKYKNGDTIHLHCGCNDCSPTRINGILCHEQGCPSAWKDRPKTCSVCEANFYAPDNSGRKTCSRHR